MKITLLRNIFNEDVDNDSINGDTLSKVIINNIIQTVGYIMKKYTCPCCGYKTLDEEPPGTYKICKICFWEDDGVQFEDPDYEGGANQVSLRQGQKNFLEFGACEKEMIELVRKPNKNDIKDEEWKPL